MSLFNTRYQFQYICVLQQPGWPTSTGWTEQNATVFCEQKIRDAQLNQKCSQAAEVTNNTADIDQNIKNCVDDIRVRTAEIVGIYRQEPSTTLIFYLASNGVT